MQKSIKGIVILCATLLLLACGDDVTKNYYGLSDDEVEELINERKLIDTVYHIDTIYAKKTNSEKETRKDTVILSRSDTIVLVRHDTVVVLQKDTTTITNVDTLYVIQKDTLNEFLVKDSVVSISDDDEIDVSVTEEFVYQKTLFMVDSSYTSDLGWLPYNIGNKCNPPFHRMSVNEYNSQVMSALKIPLNVEIFVDSVAVVMDSSCDGASAASCNQALIVVMYDSEKGFHFEKIVEKWKYRPSQIRYVCVAEKT